MIVALVTARVFSMRFVAFVVVIVTFVRIVRVARVVAAFRLVMRFEAIMIMIVPRVRIGFGHFFAEGWRGRFAPSERRERALRSALARRERFAHAVAEGACRFGDGFTVAESGIVFDPHLLNRVVDRDLQHTRHGGNDALNVVHVGALRHAFEWEGLVLEAACDGGAFVARQALQLFERHQVRVVVQAQIAAFNVCAGHAGLL